MSYKHRVLFKIPNPFHRVGDFFSNLVAVHLTTNEWGLKGYVHKDGTRSKHGRIGKLVVVFGRGAGYNWGRSLFVAYGLYLASAAKYAKDFPYPFWENIHFGGLKNQPAKVAWQMGFTQNANQVPYVDGS